MFSLYLDSHTEEGEMKLFRRFFDEYKVMDFYTFGFDRFSFYRFTLYLGPCLAVRLLVGSESSLQLDRTSWRRAWTGWRWRWTGRACCNCCNKVSNQLNLLPQREIDNNIQDEPNGLK